MMMFHKVHHQICRHRFSNKLVTSCNYRYKKMMLRNSSIVNSYLLQCDYGLRIKELYMISYYLARQHL